MRGDSGVLDEDFHGMVHTTTLIKQKLGAGTWNFHMPSSPHMFVSAISTPPTRRPRLPDAGSLVVICADEHTCDTDKCSSQVQAEKSHENRRRFGEQL